MSDLIKAVILGIVEGLTEFLPISSTGHLLIVSNLLQFEGSAGGTFEIFIQFGAVVAIFAFYGRDLLFQARSVATDPLTRRFWLAIVVAGIPAAGFGFLLRPWIKTVLFETPEVIGWALIVGGAILIAVERLPFRRQSSDTHASERDDVRVVTPRQALVIGLAQATALIPGVSRSGAAMVGGLAVGLKRSTATAFAFYLAIPTLGGATLIDLATNLDAITSSGLVLLLAGTVVSGVIAALSIKWLLAYVVHHTFVPFGVYRIVLGVLILSLSAVQIL